MTGPSESPSESPSEEPSGERDPFREATPRQAMLAMAMIFVLGLVIGFALGKTV